MTRLDNLTIPQGTTWPMAWPITDDDDDPIDLTGWTVRSQIRRAPDSSTVLHEWNTSTGNATVTDSMVTLLVPPATSTAWTWLEGVYDIELTNPDGDVFRIAEGSVTVSPGVTH